MRLSWLVIIIAGASWAQETPLRDSGPVWLRVLPSPESGTFRPLNQRERFDDYLKSTFNYFPVFTAAVAGAASQSIDSPHEWGQGMHGWSKRWVNNIAQGVMLNTINYGAAAVIHEDDRYFVSGKHGFWPRTAYALKSTLLARRPGGNRSPAYARLGAAFATSSLSRTWAPPSWRGINNICADFSIWLGVEAGLNFGREFAPDLRRHFRR
jgi:hypothetical protein